MYSLGVNKHTSDTVALSDIEKHIVASLISILLAVLKYIGTKASHMMHVVYMVNPMYLDSLNASGIFLVRIAYTVQIIMSNMG
jgi:hypothetical protein